MMEKCKNIKIVSDQEDWWFNTCVGPISLEDGKLSDIEINDYLSELKELYDNKWYSEVRALNNRNCPMVLLGGIQSPILPFIRLGQNLKTLGGVYKLDNELVKRLKNMRDVLDAYLEVEVAACFVEAGYNLDFHPVLPNNTRCDLRVKINNRLIYVEITRLRYSSREKARQQRNRTFLDQFSKSLPKSISGEVRFSSSYQVKDLKDIKRLIWEKYNEGKSHITFNNQNIELNLRSDKLGGIKFTGSPYYQPKMEGRHLIEQALEKYNQLPEGECGVIIVNPPSLLVQFGEGIIERIKGLFIPNLYTRVAGIIFTNKTIERSGEIRELPSILLNQHARQTYVEEIKKLADALGKYPDWM